MKFHSSFRRIARPGGGLFLGLRVHFPVSVMDDYDPDRWSSVTGVLGLLFWEWKVVVNYGFDSALP